MTQLPAQLIFSKFEGHADLENREHGIKLSGVSVRFDAQKLEFEVFLQASHDLVSALVCEFERSCFCLRQITLQDLQSGIQLKAEEFFLSRPYGLSEWPESLGLSQADYGAEDDGVRRLVLSPSVKELVFRTVGYISDKYPYQVYYGNACNEIVNPDPFEHKSLVEVVRFCSNVFVPGLICAFSQSNFFEIEKRIYAAFSLAHGRDLRLTLTIRGSWISFYGHIKNNQMSILQMVRDGDFPECRKLINQIIRGFVGMPHSRFEHANLALRFFLQAKQSQVLEVGFLQAMICVEAMDGMGDLQQETTQAMLGIEPDSAKLVNCMRNKLVHGKGGCRQAFEAVFTEDFKNKRPDIEKGFKSILKTDSTLDFLFLCMRLYERLDAFWCAFLGVEPALNNNRSSLDEIPLMSAIDLDLFYSAIESEMTKKTQKRQKNAAKNDELKKLRREVQELKEMLKDLGS